MDVFRIDYSTDMGVVGAFPQVHFEYFDNFDGFDIRYDIKLNEIVKYGRLYTGARFSGLLNAVDLPNYMGLLYDRCLECDFEQLNLPTGSVNVVKIKGLAEEKNYILKLFKHDFNEFLQFDKSLFCENNFTTKGEPINVDSYNDYLEKRDNAYKRGISLFTPVRLAVKSELLEKYDVFGFPEVGTDLYVTSRFRNLFLDKKDLGIQFISSNIEILI